MDTKPFEEWVKNPVWIETIKHVKKWTAKRETTQKEALDALHEVQNIEVSA